MSLCFAAIAGIPLLLSLGFSHAGFHELWDLENAYIALDNASIVLGQSARETWNGFRSRNDEIARLDRIHHPLHACARSPLTFLKCRAPDRAVELQLRALEIHSLERGTLQWGQGIQRACEAAAKRGTSVVLNRVPAPPVQRVACPVCGAAHQWELPGPPPVDRLEVTFQKRKLGNEVRSVGESLLRGPEWNYVVIGKGDGF